MMLIGCNDNDSSVKMSRTNQIPESGIVESDIFASIMKEDDIAIFNGADHQITYQWLFMGSMITEPRDENLLINFTQVKTDEVQEVLETSYIQEFSFASREDVGGDPTLTLHFRQPWDVASVAIYSHDEKSFVTTATIENIPNAVITFSPQDFKGLFYVVGVPNIEDSSGDLTNLSELLDLDVAEINSSADDRGGDLPLNDTTAMLGESILGDASSSNEYDGESYGNDSHGDDSNSSTSDSSRPTPVEPADQEVNPNVPLTATLTIRVDTLLNNMDLLDESKHFLVPSDGVIMETRTVYFSENENVYDVLRRETSASGIHMVSRHVPIYNSAYVEAIHNLFEFDGGPLSGWMYCVNGWFPNYGASRYILQQGDVIEWLYTVDLGQDIGGGFD